MTRRRRLFLAFGVILVFELGLAGLVYRRVQAVEDRFQEAEQRYLMDTAEFAATLLGNESHDGKLDVHITQPVTGPRPSEPRVRRVIRRVGGLRMAITDHTGQVVYDSTGRDLRPESLPQPQGGAKTALSVEVVPGESDSVVYVTVPIVAEGRQVGVVTVGKSTRLVQPLVEAARRNVLIVGASAGLAVLLLTLGILLWLMRPFDLIVDYIRMVRNRQYPDRPHLRRTGLGAVGAALDELVDAMAGRRYAENYVQTLTHEINAPLSAIVAGAELLEDPMPEAQRERFVTDIREQAHRIKLIVQRLLELAALENRHDLAQREAIDLASLLREVTDSLAAEARTRGIEFDITAPGGCIVEGEKFLLVRALTNLLRNALDFSPPGGRVDIRVETSHRWYQIAIRDQGPGIPAFAAKRVFERFYSLPRPDTGKKSTGLGLSFVQEIAELHRGQVDLAQHPEGGAVARIRLPKA